MEITRVPAWRKISKENNKLLKTPLNPIFLLFLLMERKKNIQNQKSFQPNYTSLSQDVFKKGQKTIWFQWFSQAAYLVLVAGVYLVSTSRYSPNELDHREKRSMCVDGAERTRTAADTKDVQTAGDVRKREATDWRGAEITQFVTVWICQCSQATSIAQQEQRLRENYPHQRQGSYLFSRFYSCCWQKKIHK